MIDLVLHRLSGDAGFELGTQVPSFSLTHCGLISGVLPLENQEVWQSRARGMSQLRKLTLNFIELAGHAVKLLNQNAMKTILHRHLQH